MMASMLPDPQIFVKRYSVFRGVFLCFCESFLMGGVFLLRIARILLGLNLWLIEPVFNKLQKNGGKL
jgi:hypothetical protein